MADKNRDITDKNRVCKNCEDDTANAEYCDDCLDTKIKIKKRKYTPQEEITRLLKIVFERAEDIGVKIVVASDEEGNSWNGLNSKSLFFGDTNPNCVALGVWGHEDENNIFEEVFTCPNCMKTREQDFPKSDETGDTYCPNCNFTIK